MSTKKVVIEAAVASVICTVRDASYGSFVSVRQRSISSIVAEEPVLSRVYGRVLFPTLQSCGVLTTKGVRGGLQYRWNVDKEYSLTHLVSRVVEAVKSYRLNQVSKKVVVGSRKVVKVRTHFDIDSTVFVLVGGLIVKGLVIGVFKIDGQYLHTVSLVDGSELSTALNTQLFETPEAVCVHLLSKVVCV